MAEVVYVIRAVDQFSATAARVSGSLRTMEGAAGRFGGALNHAKGQISGLVGSLGVLGGATALFGVGTLLTSSVHKAREFGGEVLRLKALTGESAAAMSSLASAFDHFGISSDAAKRSVGFLEKNVGLLASRKGAIADFEATFGLALTDANGKIKGANELLLSTADFFNNKTIPATQKAAAMSKLYGRSWQDLIPFLSAGRQGIADIEKEAANLGLTLNEQNLKDLVKLRDATREWDTALGGLQLQIGLALVPALTDLAKAASSFVAKNRDGIVAGFKSAATFAGQLGNVIGTVVVPAISKIAGAWNAIPKELRDLLVGGFVAQKASKFLFGAGPLDLLKSLVGLGGKKAGIGALAGIGVQHVWVDNMGVGGLGGGGLPGAAGKVGLLATLSAALPIIIGASLPLIMLAALKAVGLGDADRGPGGTGGLNQPGPRAHIPISGAIPVVVVTPGSRSGSGSTGAPGSRSRSGLGATVAAMFGPHSIASSLFASTLAEIIAGVRKRSAARFGGTGLGASAVDATFQRDILRAAGEVAKSSAGLSTKVGDLKSLQSLLTQNGDTAAAKKIQALIDKLTPGAIGRSVAGALKSPTSAEGQHTRAEARRAADRARAAAAHQLDEQRETNRLLRNLKLIVTNRDVTNNFVSTTHVGPQSGSNGRSSVLAGGA